MGIGLADGETAHQEVFHFHLLVYARFTGDNFGFHDVLNKHFVEMPRTELDEVGQELGKQLVVNQSIG